MIALLTKGRGDSAGTEGEQQVDPLVCGAVEKLRLGGAHRLPDVEGLAEDRVDRPGERGAGLVNAVPVLCGGTSSRVLAEQRGDAARSGQRPPRVETPWQPFPFLTIVEELSDRRSTQRILVLRRFDEACHKPS